ncbi:hypothetical protein [Streptomyces sp. WAC05374]|uniref:hypothetical protein n=1 Tax=Streptomyces sp. WAC05374 TaxID=2487420 RepID=UPI00163CE743|nr:hypothetical protein [Streptomyces sp. WAC05374]
MEPGKHSGDTPEWGSLSPRQKVLGAVGMTGLGLGVVALVLLAVLLGVLIVVAVARPLVELESGAAPVWGALLCLPCGLLAALFVHPLRAGLRLLTAPGRVRAAGEELLSAATTFLAVLFVASFTPGLRVRDPWVPALLATLLVALAGWAVTYAEGRRAARSGGGDGSAP